MKKIIKKYPFYSLCVVLILVNVLSSLSHIKWDITDRKRFTLTPATIEILRQVNTPIQIDILFDGSVKASTKYFAKSVEELLIEFQQYAPITFSFQEALDPSLPDSVKMQMLDSLQSMGLSPYTLRVQDESVFDQRQSVIVPGAILHIDGRTKPINFFQGLQVSGEEELFSRSEALLEYKIIEAISQLVRHQKPKIYFSSSHNEPMDMRMIEFFQTVAQEYDIDTLNLSHSPAIPSDADIFMTFLPSLSFSEQEKIKIDHYVMRGGKVAFWLNSTELDASNASSSGKLLFIPRDLNLEDLLFKYGCRIASSLVKDLQCATMPLVVGNVGDKPQIESVDWPYYPILTPNPDHIITKNLDPVLSKYTNWIDTLFAPSLTQTPLLYSSDKSQLMGVPAYISLDDARRLDPQLFTKSKLPVALLVEGSFPSLYFGRLTPMERQQQAQKLGGEWRKTSIPTSMLVVANPQILINEINKNGIVPMGFAEDMNFLFSNKSFLLNSLSYLHNPRGIIAARSKDFELQLLNIEKIKLEANFWRLINFISPLAMLLILGVLVYFKRLK